MVQVCCWQLTAWSFKFSIPFACQVTLIQFLRLFSTFSGSLQKMCVSQQCFACSAFQLLDVESTFKPAGPSCGNQKLWFSPGTQCSWSCGNAFQKGQRGSKVQPMTIFIFNINRTLGQEGMCCKQRPVDSSKQLFEPKMTLHSFSVFQVVCWLLISHLLCSFQILDSYLPQPL